MSLSHGLSRYHFPEVSIGLDTVCGRVPCFFCTVYGGHPVQHQASSWTATVTTCVFFFFSNAKRNEANDPKLIKQHDASISSLFIHVFSPKPKVYLPWTGCDITNSDVSLFTELTDWNYSQDQVWFQYIESSQRFRRGTKRFTCGNPVLDIWWYFHAFTCGMVFMALSSSNSVFTTLQNL